MTTPGGKVPHYQLRPHPIVSMVLVLVMIAGVLVAMSFFSMEDGTEKYRHRGVTTLIVTFLVSICLAIVATSKMWFPHLWKKNSTHSRHKRHTKYHPAIREQKFREEHR